MNDDFVVLPDGWKWARLGDLEIKHALWMRNGFPCGNNNEAQLGVPQLRPMNVDDSGQINLSSVKFIETDKDISGYQVHENDVIFNNTNSYALVGKTAMWDRGTANYVLSNHMTILRFADQSEVEPYYLARYFHYLWLKRYFERIRRQHVNQASVSLERLRGVEIALPPLPEQRAIAQALRTVQEAKDARQRSLALERERKAALMEHLFTRGTRGEPRKQTEIGLIPESWRVVRLGDLCANTQGLIQTGPFGSQLHSSDYKIRGIPVVNPTHLGVNTIVEDHLPFISKADADRLAKHYLRRGDIIIGRRGDFGRFSYIHERYVGWLCGTGSQLIRLNNPEVDNYFLSVSFATPLVQNYLSQNSVGSIMPNLNTKILRGVMLALPPLDEQRTIAAILRACDTNVGALKREIRVLEELFRAMLDQLMAGWLSAVPLIDADGFC